VEDKILAAIVKRHLMKLLVLVVINLMYGRIITIMLVVTSNVPIVTKSFNILIVLIVDVTHSGAHRTSTYLDARPVAVHVSRIIAP
jgi:hypothetical protein